MITLALSTDQRGFAYNATLIASILRRTGRAVWVRCWCRGFLPESFETGRLRVEFRPAVEEVTGKYPWTSGPSAYDRLLVIRDCADWDRCMVMDYDQLALCDLGPLFDLDIGDHLLAAHMQGSGVDMAYAMRVWLKRPMPEGWEHVAGHPYFLMPPLMNLKAMREAGTWEQFLKSHAAFGADEQLSLTAATEGRTLPLPAKWNLFPKLHIREGEVPEGIIHWSGWPKPWHKDAKVWRPDIWEAERATWEHLRMGIWEKPLAIEVEPDDPREVRALLERGWRVVVALGRQTEGKTQDCEVQESRDKNQATREDSAGSLAGAGAATLSRARLQAEDLGLVGFPDLRVVEGKAEFREWLEHEGKMASSVRFGPWCEPHEWLENCAAVPEYCQFRGRMDADGADHIRAWGFDREAHYETHLWPTGGPLPRVMDFSPLRNGTPLAADETLILAIPANGNGSTTRLQIGPAARESRRRSGDPVGVVVFATGAETRHLAHWLCSVRRNFLPYRKLSIHVFTDGECPAGEDLDRIAIPPLGKDELSLERYGILEKEAARFSGMSHLFLLEPNLRVVDAAGEELIGNGLTGVLHAGYHDKGRECFAYEQRIESAAAVASGEGSHYFTGLLQGGATPAFLEAIRFMARGVEQDRLRDLHAVWKAESHWNRCLIDTPPVVVLPPSHARPRWQATEYSPVILALC